MRRLNWKRCCGRGRIVTKPRCLLFVSLIASMIAGFTEPARSEISDVRIGIQFGLIYLPITVAEAQGYFSQEAKKAGLPEFKVTIQRFSGTPAINDALFSGSVDLGVLGT